MGLEDTVAAHGHKFLGLRAFGFGASLEMNWPEHPIFPVTATPSRDSTSTGSVAKAAEEYGAALLNGVEAIALWADRE